ncbi:MAG TPA: hypothetical protein VG013_25405, partial [Gemmataceae bacterium]|nr:hypothetical protein [Gemmataceae bacterium]
IAKGVKENVSFQKADGYALAAGEIFTVLNEYVAARSAGKKPSSVELKGTPYGPSNPVAALSGPVRTDRSQLERTAADVAGFLDNPGRIPTSVWLESVAVAPEAYLNALARVTIDLVDSKPMPETIEVQPARLAVAAHVANDGPDLWGWVIFPPGFRAPAMMQVAKRQAWTLKPAILHPSAN